LFPGTCGHLPLIPVQRSSNPYLKNHAKNPVKRKMVANSLFSLNRYQKSWADELMLDRDTVIKLWLLPDIARSLFDAYIPNRQGEKL